MHLRCQLPTLVLRTLGFRDVTCCWTSSCQHFKVSAFQSKFDTEREGADTVQHWALCTSSTASHASGLECLAWLCLPLPFIVVFFSSYLYLLLLLQGLLCSHY